jgi:hypothetical protein
VQTLRRQSRTYSMDVMDGAGRQDGVLHCFKKHKPEYIDRPFQWTSILSLVVNTSPSTLVIDSSPSVV